MFWGLKGGAGWCGERGGRPAALWVLRSPRHGCSLERRHHPTRIPQAPHVPQPGPTATSRPGRYIPGRPTPWQEREEPPRQPGKCAGNSGKPCHSVSLPWASAVTLPIAHLRMSNTVARGQGQGHSPPWQCSPGAAGGGTSQNLKDLPLHHHQLSPRPLPWLCWEGGCWCWGRGDGALCPWGGSGGLWGAGWLGSQPRGFRFPGCRGDGSSFDISCPEPFALDSFLLIVWRSGRRGCGLFRCPGLKG